jgi:hypothetical protein
MKQVCRLYAALALALIFALPTLAGDISCGITAPAPPTTADGRMCVAGEIPNNLAGVSEASLFDITLGILHGIRLLP